MHDYPSEISEVRFVVTDDGLELMYREWPGPDRGRPPLMLVHGFLVDYREWEDVATRLSERHRVLALDLPGYGKTPIPVGGASPDLALFVRAVSGAIRALCPGAVDLAGHSMGGGIAIAVAAHHPELVRRLVPVDALSFPFRMPFKGRLPLIPGFGRLLFKRLYGRRLFLDYFKNDVVHDPRRLNLARIDHYYRMFDRPERRDWAFRTLPLTADPSEIAALAPRVKAPTLILWGEHDRLIPRHVAESLHAAIAGSRLEWIPDSGHAPVEEQPEETARRIADFLE
ncbi:MAG: alpha/beta hydrolase [Deltaproteobacteria bacterium]|nr:alpha/beta hydrolase [Deltaproteobacteria bacterium]